MIKLQILLRQPWRNAEGVEHVREVASSLGIQPTAEGRATISAEVGEQAFETMFHTPVQKLMPQPPSGSDYGRSGGSVSGDLPIPEPLKEYIESITVAPPHIRM
jgi:hypothetical protein